MTLTISPRRTAKRLAIHFASMTDPDRPVIWTVGTGDLSRWQAWRLRRILTRRAPANVTIDTNPLIHGDPVADVPNLVCWVHHDGDFVRMEGGELIVNGNLVDPDDEGWRPCD